MDQVLAQENVAEDISDPQRVYWLLTDNLGTVRDIVDHVGDPVEHYQYDAFGSNLAGDKTLTRYLHTGREFDATTGLQYNRERWYDPNTGRWLSEDPIAADVNLYRYVGNSPTNGKDPSGLATFWDWAMDYVALNLFAQWMARVSPANPLPNLPNSGYINSVINNYGFTWIVKRTTQVSGMVESRLVAELASALAKPPGTYNIKGMKGFTWRNVVPGAILNDSDLFYEGTATVRCTNGDKHADVQLNFEVSDQVNALSFRQLYERGYFNSDSTWGQWLLGYAEGLADLQEKLKLAEPFPVSFTFSDSKSK